MAPHAPWKGETTDEFRIDIDSGRTADKVDWPDPAMAPLGTDDEAAGMPPSRKRVQLAVRQELSWRPEPTLNVRTLDVPTRSISSSSSRSRWCSSGSASWHRDHDPIPSTADTRVTTRRKTLRSGPGLER
jgi:hypothetical protein